VPKGAGVFDQVVVAEDVTTSSNYGTAGTYLLYMRADGAGVGYRIVANAGSGTNDPGTTSTTYYDTAANKIIAHNSGGDTQVSLPIAAVEASGSTKTLKRIFNGFGYIGSTAFVLPHVKWLSPAGRKPDGSLNNVEYETSSVVTRSWTYESVSQPLFLISDTDVPRSAVLYFCSDDEPIAPTNNHVIWYSPRENVTRYSGTSNAWSIQDPAWVFTGILTSSASSSDNYKITQFTDNKQVFNAVDFGNKTDISGWPMPDLNAGVTKSLNVDYQAKENGWLMLFGGGGGNGGAGASGGCNVTVNGTAYSISNTTGEARTWSRCWWPIRKGTTYKGAVGGGINEKLDMTWFPAIEG